MNWPSLSIIIPSYNQGHYIERTILSALKQEYQGTLQIVVSDGGSTDGTVDVLKKYPEIVWWSKPDKGFADAVNQALEVATGEIVAIQSSDDYYLKDAFNTAIPALVEKPELGFVTGADVSINEDGGLCWVRPVSSKTLANPEDLLIERGIAQHCTFVRRSAIDRVDGVRGMVDRCADFDLWYRILHYYPGLMLPYHFAAYQRHAEQRGQNKAQAWIDSLRLSVDSCKADEKYSREFVPSEKEYNEFHKSMEVLWNQHAGGDEGLEISKRMAREILQDGSQWSENLKKQARLVLGEPDPFDVKVAIKKFGIRTKLRQLAGGTGQPDAQASEETLDLNWWKES